MSKRVNGHTSEEIEGRIEQFIKVKKEGVVFGEIKNYLKKLEIQFKNSDEDRSGLSHMLKRMCVKGKIRKIPKDKDHKYPRYVSLNQSTFDASMDGYLMRYELGLALTPSGNIVREITQLQKKKNLSNDEEFILKNIYRFGFLFMNLILKSYERPINQNESIEKNRELQNAWLNNALDFNNKKHNEPRIFEMMTKNHFSNPEDMIDDKGELLAEQKDIPEQLMQTLSKVIKKNFPETMGIMNDTEKTIDSVKDKIKSKWLEIPQDELSLREN